MEQQWRSSLPKPCPIFHSNWCGGFCRALEGVRNSGDFQGIPWVSHTDVMSNVTDWHGTSQLPICLVPWRREYVTSRRHSCCTTAVWPGHTFSAPQRKNWCALTHALLLYQRCGVGCAWRNTNANSHWLVLLTLEGNLALSEIQLVSHTDVESKFPPSGNEGYIGNRDVRVRGCCHIS